MSGNGNFNTGTRGTCPVCNRVTFLRKKNTVVGYHGTSDRSAQAACPGWGQPPKETYVDADIDLITQVIREFNYCDYKLHSLHDVNEPDDDASFVHEWPPVLAKTIAEALRRGAP